MLTLQQSRARVKAHYAPLHGVQHQYILICAACQLYRKLRQKKIEYSKLHILCSEYKLSTKNKMIVVVLYEIKYLKNSQLCAKYTPKGLI